MPGKTPLSEIATLAVAGFHEVHGGVQDALKGFAMSFLPETPEPLKTACPRWCPTSGSNRQNGPHTARGLDAAPPASADGLC